MSHPVIIVGEIEAVINERTLYHSYPFYVRFSAPIFINYFYVDDLIVVIKRETEEACKFIIEYGKETMVRNWFEESAKTGIW